jgi:hypothetical protein
MIALPLSLATAPDRGRLLRLALRLNAAASGALGAVGLAAAPLLTSVFGLPTAVLRGTGAFLVAYAAALVVLAAMETMPRLAAWTVVIGNSAWTLGSIAAVVAARESLTALGMAVVLVQTAAVAVFAELQWLGLRRAR